MSRRGINEEVCGVVARTISKLSKKELFSTVSYFQWEQQLINSLQDDTNQEFVLQIESQRISCLLFSDFPNNFFVRLMHSFEAAVAIKYERIVRNTMTQCCEKFRNMSYKVGHGFILESPHATDGSTDEEALLPRPHFDREP